MNLYSITDITALLDSHGFSFAKKYGQNFLINEGVPKKIAESSCQGAGRPRACIEIGPGIGSLTLQLSRVYDKVVCFEIDTRLPPILSETLSGCQNVEIILEDILKADLNGVIREKFEGYSVSVCANLPYYITGDIIMRLLESNIQFESVTVMIQKEVAERLTSKPGDSCYGAITAAVNYYADVRRLFNVSPGNFIPRPKVDSTVIRLTPYKNKPVSPRSEALFMRVLHGAFAQRRKTLINSLYSVLGGDYTKDELTYALGIAGISPSCRGETLGISDFAKISDALK